MKKLTLPNHVKEKIEDLYSLCAQAKELKPKNHALYLVNDIRKMISELIADISNIYEYKTAFGTTRLTLSFPDIDIYVENPQFIPNVGDWFAVIDGSALDIFKNKENDEFLSDDEYHKLMDFLDRNELKVFDRHCFYHDNHVQYICEIKPIVKDSFPSVDKSHKQFHLP